MMLRWLAGWLRGAPRVVDAPGRTQRMADAIERILAGRKPDEAAEVLRGLASEVRGLGWVALDESLRRWHRPYGGVRGPSPSPEDVLRLRMPEDAAVAVFGVMASLPDGYVREAAVQRLAEAGDGRELGPLLVRASDWVEPVRRRAAAALRDRLRPELAPAWVDALVLVVRLRRCERTGVRALVSDVETFLTSDVARSAVMAGLDAEEREVRRACFRYLLAGSGGDGALIRRGLENPDGVVRVHAAGAAAGMAGGGALAPLLLADPLPEVRVAGVHLAAGSPNAEAAIRRALADRAAAVRREARGALGWAREEFAAVYRDALSGGAHPIAAVVAGLSETGGAEDAPRVEPFLSDPRPSVRRSAVIAIDRLAGDAAASALVRAVGDVAPSVSRAAALRLLPRIRRVGGGDLASCLLPGRPPHVRVAALSLLAERDKWDGLPPILGGLTDTDPAVRQTAHELLDRWRERFNRSSVAPSPEQRASVARALAGAGGSLSPERLRWLRFVLR